MKGEEQQAQLSYGPGYSCLEQLRGMTASPTGRLRCIGKVPIALDLKVRRDRREVVDEVYSYEFSEDQEPIDSELTQA
jgi:hypothetical protein